MTLTTDLKCPHRQKHGVLHHEDGVVEIKCDRSHCGARKGVVVIHRWDIRSGDLVDTRIFAEPSSTRKE